MDYEALYREGIEYIQQYSGARWTDYNHHDPGITILEYLCFGLTDIGYRCNFSITDLLYSRENRRLKPANNAFFPPEKILPCAPLTIRDYRRLLIDRLPEAIVNIWFEPVEDQREKCRGLYDVRLQINKESKESGTPEQIRQKVAGLLSENRNLCEDIRHIYILEEQHLDIKTVIDLETDAPAEQVLATLIHELEHFLSPKITFYNPEELLASGMDVNTLFDGPEPRHGYIRMETLKPLNSIIYLSQLRDVITAMEGVRKVEKLAVLLNGIPQFEEVIHIPENTCLGLSAAMKNLHGPDDYPIEFRRNGQPVKPKFFMAEQMLTTLTAQKLQYFNQKFALKQPATNSEKDLADIGAYYSIQRFFPAVFGIGAYGLPRDANALRQAQALQLKGLLAIFETLPASYLKQLTRIRDLFSIGEKNAADSSGIIEIDLRQIRQPDTTETDATYFTAFPFDIPDIELLLATEGPDARRETEAALHRIMAANDEAAERRNEFLDHLLARFGETVDGEWLNRFLTAPDDFSAAKKHLIHFKRRILQEYDTLSRDRGKGFDALNRNWDGQAAPKNAVTGKTIKWGETETSTWVSYNVSGLKKRLCYLLHLDLYADRALTDFFPFPHFKTKKIQSGANDAPPGLPMRGLLRNGRNTDNYHIVEIEKDRQYEVRFLDQRPAQTPDHKPEMPAPGSYLLFRAQNRAEAETKRQHFIDSVIAFDWYGKGFFVVEHILLRPMRRGGHQLVLNLNNPNIKDSFESLGYRPLEEVNGIAEGLLAAAANKDNYAVLPDGKDFFVVLKQNNRPILVSSNSHHYLDAMELLNTMPLEFQTLLKNNPGAINDKISFEPETVKGLEVDNEFYSHRLSIVLPDWPGLFSEPDFQLYFKHLVAQNIPAHLRADIHWLDWAEMKTFESLYHRWLVAKSRPDTAAGELDELSFSLVEKLTPPGAGRDHLAQLHKSTPKTGLSKNRINALVAGYGLSFLLNPTELQIIDGIDETAEYWLKKEHIGTWALLSVARIEQLNTLKDKPGLRDLAPDFNYWKEQAALAAGGKWDKLEQLQQGQNKTLRRISKLKKMGEEKLKALQDNQA